MKNITILTPIKNERENLPLFIQSIQDTVSRIEGYNFTHVFVDNLSSDGSAEIVCEQIKTHKHIGLIMNQKD